MDATTAAGLLELAEDAQRRRRRQDPQAEPMVEERYGEVRKALGWYGAAGPADTAFRLAGALVPFWIATKRIEEGDALHGYAAPQIDRAGGEWPADERAQHEETLAALGANLPADAVTRFRNRAPR